MERVKTDVLKSLKQRVEYSKQKIKEHQEEIFRLEQDIKECSEILQRL